MAVKQALKITMFFVMVPYYNLSFVCPKNRIRVIRFYSALVSSVKLRRNSWECEALRLKSGWPAASPES